MSSLQQQLTAIAASSTHQLDLKAQKKAHSKSLLFEPAIAAAQDFHTIYQVCIEGFEELCQLDGKFSHFAANIFSEQSKAEDRGQLTVVENAALDRVLEDFFHLVSSRVLLKPALKSIEWLIRRFRVHECNTELLLLTFLPHHAFPIFTALLSLLPAKLPSNFKFLHPYIRSLSSPPLDVVIHAASNDPNVFSALGRHMLRATEASYTRDSAIVSLWVAVSTRAVENMLDRARSGRPDVELERQEKVLLLVLPLVRDCIRAKSRPELQLSSYMLLTIVTKHSSMTKELLAALMKMIAQDWTLSTVEAGLLCLEAMMDAIPHTQLPQAVVKRILRLPDSRNQIELLIHRHRARNVLFGIIVGVSRRSSEPQTKASLQLFCRVIRSNVLSSSQQKRSKRLLHQMLQNALSTGVISNSDLDSLASDLSDPIGLLTNSTPLEKSLVSDLSSDVSQNKITHDGQTPDPDPEVLQNSSSDNFLTGLRTLHTIKNIPLNFISADASTSFKIFSSVFSKVTNDEQLQTFMDILDPKRAKPHATSQFLTFIVRVWCGPFSAVIRSKALQAFSRHVRDLNTPSDFQALLPYLLPCFADSERTVRNSTAECLVALKQNLPSRSDDVEPLHVIFPTNSETDSPDRLMEAAEYREVLSRIVAPRLEEFTAESGAVERILPAVIEGDDASQHDEHKKAKKHTRVAFVRLLAQCAAATPLLCVRVGVLKFLAKVGKTATEVRNSILLPAMKRWMCDLQEDVFLSSQLFLSKTEAIVDCYLTVITERESDGLAFLVDIITTSNPYTTSDFLQATHKRLRSLWPAMKRVPQISMAETLLDLASNVGSDPEADDRRKEAHFTISTVPTSSPVLQSLLTSASINVGQSETSPSKRHKSGDGQTVDTHRSYERQTSNRLRRLTIALEVVANSDSRTDPMLLGILFDLFYEVQQFRTQTGSTLAYIELLLTQNLLSIMDKIKASSRLDQSAIRMDVLVECVRTSSSPQVQSSALLLIACLAAWTPEVVLHSVMPIFTFMESTLLRQGDDYSVHVIQETISRVTPPLVDSLRKRRQDLVTGAPTIFYSFTSAYEHIPSQRKLGLFKHLCLTLGPLDSLHVITAMLLDRYPTDNTVRHFVKSLVGDFETLTQLEMASQLLGLIQDHLSPKPSSQSQIILDSNNVSDKSDIVMHIFDMLTSLLGETSFKTKLSDDMSTSETLLSQATALQVALYERSFMLLQVVSGSVLKQSCGQLIDCLLSLLPTTQLLPIASKLLQNSDVAVLQHTISAISRRATELEQNDRGSASAVLRLFPSILAVIQNASADAKTMQAAINCLDTMSEHLGKTDSATILQAGQAILNIDLEIVGVDGDGDRIKTSSLFCVASILEAVGSDVAPLFPTMLQYACDRLSEAVECKSEDLHNVGLAFITTAVERVAYFLSDQQIGQILRLAYMSTLALTSDECAQSRLHLYQALIKKIDSKTWIGILGSQWTTALEVGYGGLFEHIRILSLTLARFTKSTAIHNADKIFDLVLQAFDIRRVLHGSDDPSRRDVKDVEQLVIDAALGFTLKLNDVTFRPLFVKFLDWTRQPFAESDSTGLAVRYATLFNFLANFADRLKGLATKYFAYVLDTVSEILQGSLMKNDLCATAMLQALLRGMESDQDDFWQAPARFESVARPLVQQLAHGSQRQTPELLISVITALCAVVSSVDQHKSLNHALLELARSGDARTRSNAIAAEHSITRRVGDEWLALLPEMLPVISELQEDDDDEVGRATQSWINTMEEVLGESLDDMLV